MDTNISFGKYKIVGGLENQFNVCYKENRSESNNLWETVNPLTQLLPKFMMQLCMVISLTRIFMMILKPIRQPRFVSEILAGIVLGPSLLSGPSLLADNSIIATSINPFEANLLLETMGNLGVTFYMFLVGLEMDITPIQRMGKTACSVTIAGIILPLFGGLGLYQLLRHERKESPPVGGYFWAIALTVTSFPDLARILSSLKLMYTDLGKTAMTSAILTDLASWVLLVIAVSTVNAADTNMLWALQTVVFVVISWFVMRPSFLWLMRRTAARKESSMEGQYSDKHVCFILSAVLLFGLLTELCGVHSMFGAFMFGLMIPSGELGTKVMDKIEDFVVGIMLPPLFLIAGLRTNIGHIYEGFGTNLVVLVILASSIKIMSTFLVCLYLKCPIRDSLALGVLMNTKGVIAIIVLSEGRNVKGFDQQTFTWMMISILIMTGMVGPIVGFTHNSKRYLKHYYRRNLESSKQDAELRVLACLHSSRNISGLINLLHISNATRKSPITVFAVHLVELTGRASAMLIFHDNSDKINDVTWNTSNPNREEAESEQIVSAFESFKNDNHAAFVQQLTAVSPYASMHEDVSNFAVDKRVTLILLPFHKKHNGLGGWTDENSQHKQVTENLLANAPCSIGILVDRGLTRHLHLESEHDRIRKFRIAMLFVQGPDDREALAYAWRMASNPGVILTVVRFIPGKDLQDQLEDSKIGDDDDADSGVFSAMFEKEKEILLDDDYLNEFRFRTMNDKSIAYMEKPVNSGDEIVSTIRSAYYDFDLYIVGRGYGMQSPLTLGLSEWSDCPELGVIGETLVAVDFLPSASVLVMQQSAPTPRESKKGVFGSSGQSSAQLFVNHRTRHDYY
ncbi:hypothetical protein REPUB_Repub12eG0211900 [Reevesia pubescens]